jgi:hypothetical protein
VKPSPQLPEKELQAQVLGLAWLLGWRCYHTHDSRRSAPGFPDLVLVRPPRCLFVELKSEQGRLRTEQAAWLEALAGCSRAPEAYLWRPADFEDIQAVLTMKGAA